MENSHGKATVAGSLHLIYAVMLKNMGNTCHKGHSATYGDILEMVQSDNGNILEAYSLNYSMHNQSSAVMLH